MKALATRILDLAKAQSATIATVESCTGGMVAAALTAIPGSSAVFERGWATYSNQAKHDEVGVPLALISAHGAVSEPVALAMAEGALRNSPVTLAVSITGIAGPDGGSKDKPVGLVHFACAKRGQPTLHRRHVFSGDRDQVRTQATMTALSLLEERLL
jgi:nicotinamide-nucleotide amidase